MLKDLRDKSSLKETTLIGESIPSVIIESTTVENLLAADGVRGDKTAGEPIQYDYLAMEHTGGKVEITVNSRAIMLLFTNTELLWRDLPAGFLH